MGHYSDCYDYTAKREAERVAKEEKAQLLELIEQMPNHHIKELRKVAQDMESHLAFKKYLKRIVK